MDPISSGFETLAEIAGALLGFAVLAFSLAGKPEELSGPDKIRLWLLLSLAVGSIIGGLLPEILALRGLEDEQLWRIWSACFLGGALQIFLIGAVSLARMTAPERRSYYGETPMARITFHIQNLIMSAVALTQVLNIVGVGFHGEQWICLTALLVGVVQAAVVLLMIIFLRPVSAA